MNAKKNNKFWVFHALTAGMGFGVGYYFMALISS